MVIGLIQATLQKGHLTEEWIWKTVVFKPKGNGDSLIIRFVEVLCKTIMEILNFRIEAVIQFHNMLHGFITKRGTSTASLESKLPQ